MQLRIAHVDMDAFFASVEERANPRLKGRPVLVGGGPRGREVVTTASYPARVFGIRSGMSLNEAFRRCPEAHYCPVDPPRYISASEAILKIFESVTPMVEPASIDEAFLDLGGMGLDDRSVLNLARSLQERIMTEQSLSCSIGLGAGKLQAKMASGVNKPAGFTPLYSGDFENQFWSQPVRSLWGVGPKTMVLLEQAGLRTIDDLAHAPGDLLDALFGTTGPVLKRMACGEGGGPVIPRLRDVPSKSMGHEMTLVRSESETSRLETHLLLLCDRLSRKLRLLKYSGYTVRLRIKRDDGSVITRQMSLAMPTDDENVLLDCARRLLRRNHDGRSVRLVGVSVDQLVRCNTPLPFLDEDVRRRSLIRVKDGLRNRFGESSLFPAGVLPLLRKGFDDPSL